MNDENNFEGEELDIEPYEGLPDFPVALSSDGGAQDTIEEQILGLLARGDVTNTWRETLQWYKDNETKAEIGFDPDGMCLKICRTARQIGPRYLTARESMLATPPEHRVTRARDIRRGMVMYFADPRDGNNADHIVTPIGRVKGFDPDSFHDILTITNSVQADRLTIVRASYFEDHWGDPFTFAATWLNGVELDVPNHGTKLERFHDTAPEYNLRLLARADRPKAQRILDQIESQVRRLPNSPKLINVQNFKLKVKDDHILDLRILDDAVKAGRVGLVKTVRDEIRRLIGALPEE